MTPFELTAREHANSRGAKGTRKLYISDLERWLAWCAKHGHDAAAPTLAAASAFKDELLETQAALTVRRTLAALAAMYAHAVSAEQPLATWNPWKRVPRPSADDFSQTKEVSAEDAEKVIRAAETDPSDLGFRDAAILRLMYETGLRRKSVATLRRDDIFERDGATIARVLVKGDRRQEVVLPESTARAIANWIDRAEHSLFVFPAMRGKKALHVSAVNKIVYARAKQAGVKGLHPHSFRAAFATTAITSGMALHEVQAAMHHRSPLTTLRYDRGVRGTGVTAAVSAFRKKEKQS